MTRKPRHPVISEDELLDLVEGRMPLERIEALEPALRADPDLAARLKSMARDRAILSEESGRTYSAPPGLIEGALAQAEREALMADSTGRRASASGGLMLPKLIGGLAAGVAIALTVALTATFLLTDRGPEGEQLAIAEAPVSSIEEPLDDESGGAPSSLPMRFAEAEATQTIDHEDIANAGAVVPAAAPMREALADADLDRAERLARDGRLRLVVTSGDSGTVELSSLERLEGVRARDGRRVIRPLDLAMFGVPSGIETAPVESDRAIYTDVLDRGTYTAETGLDGVRAMIRGLEAAGYGVRVEQSGRARRPETRPEDVLWWTPTEVNPPAARTSIELAVRGG